SIVAYIYTTQVEIYELALVQPTSQITLNSSILNYIRTDYLMKCFQACKSCTQYFIASDIITSTTPTKLTFSHGLRVLHKLATFQDASWDPSIVRQTVDIVGLLERCAAGLEQANARLKEETGEDSVLVIGVKMLRDSVPSWSVQNQEPQTGDSAMDEWTSTEGMDLPLMGFSDDLWLNAPFNL
ncbi:hypothetical protein CC80DRAFT_578659, partial [Byssothecium circinans]